MAITATTAAILAATAGGFAAAGSIQSGRAAKKQADLQAQSLRDQAARARVVAAQGEEDFRRGQSAAAARVRAAMGARGVVADVGSPLLSSEDFAAETEVQAQRIREGGSITASRLEQQADLTRLKGKAARTAGIIGAGTSLLSGGTRAARILT